MIEEKKKNGIDMLNGSLWSGVLLFALPLAASSIVQQLFNSADMAVVGKFVGKEALAAVGSNGSVINLLVNVFVGLSVGANVVISRYIGEKNEERVKKAVHSAIVLALASGIFIMCVGVAIARPILTLMSAPEDIIDLSTLYLRIYFLGMPFLMLYNFEAAILRSRGDTQRPLITLFISGIVNVLLNLFFVIVCRLSVAGVAIATSMSNVVSSGILFYFLTHEKGALKVYVKKLKIDKRCLLEFIRIGLPAGLQGVVFSVSNVCIQSSLNKLGSDFVAGCAAAINFEFFVYYMLNAFSQACVTFTGQNYGAGNFKRCANVARRCLILGFVFTSVMCAGFIFFGDRLIYIYTDDAAVAKIALIRMTCVLSFQFLNLFIDVLSGSMRGVGHSFVPAVISAVGVCGVRLLWVYTVFPHSPNFSTLIAVYPVSWAVTAAAIVCAYFILKKKLSVIHIKN